MRVWRIALAALSLMVAALPAMAAERLVIGISQYPATLHPNIDSMAAKAYVLGATHRPFTQYGPDWLLRCYLCTGLPTIENGGAEVVEREDGTKGVRMVFEIRDDAFWGDGTPVTAEDALFTWEVGRHPSSGVSNAELYRRMLKLEVLGEKRFAIEDEKLSFQYNAINDFRLLPAHLERPVFEADPATYRNRTLYVTAPETPGLWSGPYRVDAIEPGSHLVLVPNEHWKGAAPAFDQVVIRAIEDSRALQNALLAGDVDMLDGALGLPLDQALAFEKATGDRFAITYRPGLFYEHLDLMLDNPILADRRVRRALVLGIDRGLIAERLFEGRQPVADTGVSPLDPVHAADVPRYGFDPDRAAALLDEAGWPLGPDGIRRNAAGEPLRLSLMTTAGNATREAVQQVLQHMWRELGIEIRIENQPARVFFGETVSKRRFDGLALFAWISSPENVPRTTLHSDQVPDEANGWAGQNYTGFRNPRMDELLDAIEIELDADKRKALWAELQHLYAAELPAIPLWFRANAHIWPHWLEGVEPTGHMAPTTLGIEHWRRRPAG